MFISFLDDDQKKMRKQKILINKLKRHGSLPPEDTYAVSDSDLKQSYNQKIVKQSVSALRKQYPSLSMEEITCLQNMKSDQSTANTEQSHSSEANNYEPWQEVKAIMFQMEEKEREVLNEMNVAHENSSFLSNTETKLKSIPSTPTELFNIADGFVRRIIKVVKQLNFFRSIHKDDQIALLKGSVVEVMVLRSAVNFDVKTEAWTLNTKQCINTPVPSTRSTPSATITSPVADSQETSTAKPPFRIPPGLNIDELSKAAKGGADINALRNLARNKAEVDLGSKERLNTGHSLDLPHSNLTASSKEMLNLSELRNAAMKGADLNTLRDMAKFGPKNTQDPSENTAMNFQRSHNLEGWQSRPSSEEAGGSEGLEHVRNTAKAAGLDVDALRHAAMNGASFEDLARMARGEKVELGQQQESGASSSNISSEILKMGNSETRTMFLTYSKFVRSLMKTIHGDLTVLKFMIMLSLFSSDRPGIVNRELIEKYQETYASVLQKYIHLRFPDNKKMFAQCIMKLTDLRNVNEIHTKMLLKMQIQDIEPLLVEIFDLPQ